MLTATFANGFNLDEAEAALWGLSLLKTQPCSPPGRPVSPAGSTRDRVHGHGRSISPRRQLESPLSREQLSPCALGSPASSVDAYGHVSSVASVMVSQRAFFYFEHWRGTFRTLILCPETANVF